MRRDKQSTNFVKKSESEWKKKTGRENERQTNLQFAWKQNNNFKHIHTHIEAIECSVNILRFLVYY